MIENMSHILCASLLVLFSLRNPIRCLQPTAYTYIQYLIDRVLRCGCVCGVLLCSPCFSLEFEQQNLLLEVEASAPLIVTAMIFNKEHHQVRQVEPSTGTKRTLPAHDDVLTDLFRARMGERGPLVSPSNHEEPQRAAPLVSSLASPPLFQG